MQPYEYYDRDALVITKAAVLEEIAAGKLDVVKEGIFDRKDNVEKPHC